jgi:CRISPR-associated protein (TIGR02584 family)
MTPTVVFATLGANPAPLLQLVWALHRKWDWSARDVSVVVDARGMPYLHAEALARGAAWDDLRAALGASCLERDRVRVVPVYGEDGELLPDDESPDDAARYSEAAWRGARRAIELAGDDPVVFALVAGHRRTQHVAATVLFQLLARPQDRLVDVRLSERWAYAPGAFYFPEQASRGPRLARSHAPNCDPADVDVHLVDVQAPRLRGLLRQRDLMTHASALRAGQVAIDALVGVRLLFDMEQGCARLGREVIVLSKTQFIWYATLARQRCLDNGGEGWLATGDANALERVAHACRSFGWNEDVRMDLLRRYMGLATESKEIDEEDQADSLTKLRADTLRALRKFAKGRPRDLGAMIVPAKRKEAGVNMQRLPLEPAHIEFLGVDGW